MMREWFGEDGELQQCQQMMQASLRMNNIATWANFSNNGARELEFGLFDGRMDADNMEFSNEELFKQAGET